MKKQKPTLEALVSHRDLLNQQIEEAAVDLAQSIKEGDKFWVLCEVVDVPYGFEEITADSEYQLDPVIGSLYGVPAKDFTPDKIRKA